jgi:hypothetical protein
MSKDKLKLIRFLERNYTGFLTSSINIIHRARLTTKKLHKVCMETRRKAKKMDRFSLTFAVLDYENLR